MAHVPYIALLAAFALIYVPRLVVTREMLKQPGGYDNRDPRGQQQKLEGVGRRAVAAHMNSFEAFAPFAVAVLAAAQRGVRVELAAWIAIAFVVARAVYVAAYLADKSKLRSTMWGFGVAATTALMFAAVIA
jgi:uncharacterized MAPEG superfamily protein